MVASYLNPDGLYLKFGPDKGTASKAGEYVTAGELRMHEVTIDLATLGTARAILSDVDTFPKSVRVEAVEIVTQTAATGATAVLNVGLVRGDRTTTYDDDGFIAALTVASIAAVGTRLYLTAGSTSAGAFIGTSLANNGLLVADYDTAAFTAGVVRVRIYYYAVV